jgi:hypothetical protein
MSSTTHGPATGAAAARRRIRRASVKARPARRELERLGGLAALALLIALLAGTFAGIVTFVGGLAAFAAVAAAHPERR